MFHSAEQLRDEIECREYEMEWSAEMRDWQVADIGEAGSGWTVLNAVDDVASSSSSSSRGSTVGGSVFGGKHEAISDSWDDDNSSRDLLTYSPSRTLHVLSAQQQQPRSVQAAVPRRIRLLLSSSVSLLPYPSHLARLYPLRRQPSTHFPACSANTTPTCCRTRRCPRYLSATPAARLWRLTCLRH